MGRPLFFYDFASPDAYLAAERVMPVLPEVPEWIPVRLGGLAKMKPPLVTVTDR